MKYIAADARQLEENVGYPVVVGGQRIALFLHEGRYFAVQDFCPHMGASLAGGVCQEGIIACPMHGWRFRLTDGAWLSAPKVKIATFAVDVCDGKIVVDLPSLTNES